MFMSIFGCWKKNPKTSNFQPTEKVNKQTWNDMKKWWLLIDWFNLGFHNHRCFTWNIDDIDDRVSFGCFVDWLTPLNSLVHSLTDWPLILNGCSSSFGLMFLFFVVVVVVVISPSFIYFAQKQTSKKSIKKTRNNNKKTFEKKNQQHLLPSSDYSMWNNNDIRGLLLLF